MLTITPFVAPDLLKLHDIGSVCNPSGQPHDAVMEDRLVDLVVKASASKAEDPGFESRLRSLYGHTSDSKIGTPVATLPGAWRYRVRAGTGWPDVSTQ